MSDYSYSISLRVTHPSIDPDAITQELGIEPSRKWKVGEKRTTPTGTLLEGNRKESYWVAEMHDERRLLSSNVYLEDYLVKLNNYLEGHKGYLKKKRGQARFNF